VGLLSRVDLRTWLVWSISSELKVGILRTSLLGYITFIYLNTFSLHLFLIFFSSCPCHLTFTGKFILSRKISGKSLIFCRLFPVYFLGLSLSGCSPDCRRRVSQVGFLFSLDCAPRVSVHCLCLSLSGCVWCRRGGSTVGWLMVSLWLFSRVSRTLSQ